MNILFSQFQKLFDKSTSSKSSTLEDTTQELRKGATDNSKDSILALNNIEQLLNSVKEDVSTLKKSNRFLEERFDEAVYDIRADIRKLDRKINELEDTSATLYPFPSSNILTPLAEVAGTTQVHTPRRDYRSERPGRR